MKTEKLKIVIVDDQPERSRGWSDNIQAIVGEQASVLALKLDEVQQEVKAVFTRRKEFRDGAVKDEPSPTVSLFDEVDILILDFDLRYMDISADDWTTGAEVAIAARAFTKVKTIVLVNGLGDNRFDLAMNKANNSKADIDIGGAQIDNPGLWLSTASVQYRPWSWPSILDWSMSYEKAVNWVEVHLEKPVLESLGFNLGGDATDQSITKEDWLELGIDPTSGTFRDLVKINSYLPPQDQAAVGTTTHQAARVATAIIRSWIDKVIVPSQETLIDAPHLVYLKPWLLKDPSKEENWNLAASLTNPFIALQDGVKKYLYPISFLASKPVFYRRKIESDENLFEPVGFDYSNYPDLVFCEDLSKFIDFNMSRPYPSGLRGSDNQRYVSDPTKLPKIQGSHTVIDVNYEPAALFAL